MISHGIDNVGALLPHDRPVTKGGSMAAPTQKQRTMFAKMGIAMPDGTYYIRDAGELSDAIKAVGRGNADHDTIRKHIITRAHALHLDKQIPSDWNPDGSEKSAVVKHVIEHFGVKGMHWGVRNSSASSGGTSKHDALIEKAKKHENVAASHAALAKAFSEQHQELQTHGVYSKAFKTAYGDKASTASDQYFQWTQGRSKAVALGELDNNLRLLHNSHVRSTNRHAAKAIKLRAKASGMQHSDLALLEAMDDEAVLAHFGIKGMHWGVRNANPGSADHQRAQEVHGLIKTGGVKSATNKDLQDLITRLNLEQQHARLTATPSRVEAGHNFIRKTLGLTKTGLDVVQTGARVASTVNDVRDAAARHQRNRPLKVVRIGA
jgi:hypothetical protein